MKKKLVFGLYCVIFTLISASVCFADDWDIDGFGAADTYPDSSDDDPEPVPGLDSLFSNELPSSPEPAVTADPGAQDAATAVTAAEAAAVKAEAAAEKAVKAAENAAAAAAESAAANTASQPQQQPPVRIVIPMMATPAYPPSAAPVPPPPPPAYHHPPALPPTPPAYHPPAPQQPPPVYLPPVQPAPPVYQQPPITVIPAMPHPYSTYLYRVQVGAFSSDGLAQQCFSRLLSAGFSPVYEPYGSVCRVVVPGIRAAEMPLIVQRLAAAGFSEVWIREEK